ncbi:autotransporter outer membrane beta-barrel domain-containing protein [Yersinia rochesterensis]|uniref:autotransporter outer membrane beta-barrel domain-containing protein n=1 Tax=Yersinia rochesterensis TaxID=1604335 RepID=UPI001643EE3A|nr:autotransporter outer membrane beta-barrel domain-containing protein [Yersinia rochesterensis]
MSHHNTLNTRLLPLSILISSLVSGGAVAASTPAVTLSKLQDYLNQGVMTSEQKGMLVTQLADKKIRLDTQAVAKQAQEAAKQENVKATSDKLSLSVKSSVLKALAKKTETAKTNAELELTRLDTEKTAAITAVDPTWNANTPDLAKELQDLIDNSATSPADKAKAKVAQEAIAKAAAADQLFQDATTAHTTAENSAQDTTTQYQTAQQHKIDAIAALATKTTEMDAAIAAVAQLDKVTDPTIAMPVFEQTIAQSEQQTVAANTLAFATQVAGGTQNVEDGGKALDSIISDDGTLNLATGALANNTVITKGIINNNGGTDHDSVINDGGTLVLTGAKTQDANGKDVINTAESHGAKILKGGTATVGEFAEIHNLSSTEGTVELNNGAKADGTSIKGGTLTIAAGASAENTSLTNASLELVDGATANSTKLAEDAVFTLKANAKTSGTELHADNSEFILEKGSSASATSVTNGTMTVNDGASANGVNVTDEGTLILKSGAVVKGAQIFDRAATFALESGATASDTQLHFAELELVKGATADDTTLLDGSTFTLLEGAETKNTSIGSDSNFIANTKATANNTTINGGKFRLEQGAIANITALDSGEFIVDGTAKDTTVKGGKFALNQGATANITTLNDGEFTVKAGAKTTATTVNGGIFDVQAGAAIEDTVFNAVDFTLVDKATANNTTVNDSKLTINEGAIANNTKVKGGKFDLMARAQAHKLVVENGHALISGHLMDATFNSSTVIFDKTADINGIIDANKNSFLSVQGGATTQNADLNLAGNMQLFAVDAPLTAVQSASRAAFAGNNGKPAQFAFKNVRLAGGSIDMSKSNTQLTMASLAGRGLFNLGSALFSQSSAPLKVAGDAAGTFDVQINNSGVAPANLNVVDVKGKNTAHFVLANGPVDLGNYKHSLVSDGKGSFKLVADKTKVTSNTAGILAVANTMPVIFNAELSSIHNRLDKQSSAANESGVWLTYLNDSYDVKGTATNFNQKLSGVTLGGDKAIELGNAVFSVGSFASHTSSNIKSDYQSSGSVESNSLGAYVQYLANSGYYLNGVFKTNQFKQNLSVASQANNATGTANFSGMGLAVKAGKHINIDAMYVSPYVALNTFSSGKSQYKLSNGMEAQNQGSRTTTGTLGMNTGYRFVLNSGAEIKPYAIFSVDHDLMASNKVMINNEMFDNNLKGTRANVGMGINVNLTSNLSIGSEVKVSKGKNITTPMTINMGVAYTF